MFKAILISKQDGAQSVRLADVEETELPEAPVTVRVEYSTINYKDGLAITGKSPVVRKFPMVPGIDMAGVVEDGTPDAGDVFESAVGENETEFALEFRLFADRLIDVLFEPVAVVGMDATPEERCAGLIFVGVGTEDQEMLTRPFDFAVGEVPDPTAGMAEFLSFLEEEFAGALLFIAEGVVDGESNLIGDE